MIPVLRDGRQADTERRRQRVATAVKNAARNGTPISVSAIARQAGVDRSFLYRHRDLLEVVHAAELEPAAQDPAGTSPVSRASLQADLANAQARSPIRSRCREGGQPGPDQSSEPTRLSQKPCPALFLLFRVRDQMRKASGEAGCLVLVHPAGTRSQGVYP